MEETFKLKEMDMVDKDSNEMADLRAKLAETEAKLAKVEGDRKEWIAKHEALADEHEALRIQFKLSKPKYLWKEGDSACEPVAQGAKCANCGWTHGTLDSRGMPQPHPIAT